MNELGKLVQIDDLRNIWRDEARHFTPWLARPENLQQLSEFLGLGPDGLELESVEKFVGPYRADILCRDTNTGDWVLVENQLERTDHNHLGQLLVYAAGLDAKTVIWISKRVSPEHKAAIEWLNDISEGGPSFFALEIELWRIGDSPPAPRFNAAVRPNDWTRSAAAAKKGLVEAELSPLKQMQLAYWTAVEELVGERSGPLRKRTALAQSWFTHGIGKTGVMILWGINTRENWIRTDIYLTGPNAKQRYYTLSEHRAEIENALRFTVEWQELPDGSDSRIASYLHDVDPSDEADWPRQHRWLVETAEKMHEVFGPYVARLE